MFSLVLKMEVDVRLFVLALMSVVLKAEGSSTKGSNETDKVLYQCKGCSNSQLSTVCRQSDNGSMSCTSCKRGFEHLHVLCNKCSSGVHYNLTSLQGLCNECQCNGSIDLIPSKTCNSASGACFICRPNSTEWYCEQCVNGNHGSSAFEEKCVFMSANPVPSPKTSGFSTKEQIIVGMCSAVGVICIIVISFFFYRHHKRNKNFKNGRPFWTVELTNRNYDDLDFSLLDPITDIPLVYRTDISDFDNDALLGPDKPQLIMEVDEEGIVS